MAFPEHPGEPSRRSGPEVTLIMLAGAALVLAVAASSLWLVGAAIVPAAALVLREQSPDGAARSTAATLAAGLSLILLGLGIAHA
ncbi:hypothetical protein [Symbioplanes lichenis]|uniref:hypothetical protein n=1 Tax=Symbioplanes lichenis TaxID=1629072 RepID=UPI002739EC9F|nr:hypothetical protein [Actinoplanes lichenis]